MHALEQDLFFAFNQGLTHPLLDWWAALVSAKELWLLPALAAVVTGVVRGTARLRAALVLALLAIGIGDGLIVRPAKHAFARPRPDASLPGVRRVRLARVEPRVRALAMPLETWTDRGLADPSTPGRSFPSGHAWNAFAVATILAFACRRWGWLAFVPAVGVAAARIYAGMHWPSDVLVAAVGGALMGLALALAYQHLRTWVPSRVSARLPSLVPAPVRE